MRGFDLIIKPDEEDIEAAEVLVDATIGGHPYRFLLDTGAARTSVSFDDYTSTFDCIEKNDSSGVFAASRQRDLIQVPLIELGPLSKSDFVLVRQAEHDAQQPNLLGMDFLKDFCWHFLFDENRVVVPDDPEQGLPFQELILGKKFHPYIDIQLGELKARAVWDTGAGMTVADIHLIQKNPAFFQEIGHSQGTDSTGATMQTPLFIITSAFIGGQEFAPHKVAGVDLSRMNANTEIPLELILGYTTLSQVNWMFDFPGKRWALSKRVSSQ